MSEISAAAIRSTLGQFDAFVRVTVEQGNIDQISAKEGEIVSNGFIPLIATHIFLCFKKKFYKICMRYTDPERVAAFNSNLFLHNFLREYRKNKTSPTFLDDQRERLIKFDKKKLSDSWALQIEPVIAAVNNRNTDVSRTATQVIPAAIPLPNPSGSATQAIPVAITGKTNPAVTIDASSTAIQPIPAAHPNHSSMSVYNP